jgi:hypothetical protein
MWFIQAHPHLARNEGEAMLTHVEGRRLVEVIAEGRAGRMLSTDAILRTNTTPHVSNATCFTDTASNRKVNNLELPIFLAYPYLACCCMKIGVLSTLAQSVDKVRCVDTHSWKEVPIVRSSFAKNECRFGLKSSLRYRTRLSIEAISYHLSGPPC